MKIQLFGDWCPGRIPVTMNYECDLALVNLEGPILDVNFDFIKNKLHKVGPHIFSTTLPKFSSKFIFSLANNHIMDFGLEGVKNTVNKVRLNNHEYAGFKFDSESKVHSRIHLINDKYLTVLANAEHQFGYIQDSKPGYIPVSDDIFLRIEEAKRRGDFVIVSNHGGNEKSFLPTRERRNLLRDYISAGADVVWGHHAHVPQGWEFWDHGLICYGLGNFVTDPNLISHENLGKHSLYVTLDTENLQNSKFGITKQTYDGNSLVVELFDLTSESAKKHFDQLGIMIKDDVDLIAYLDMYALMSMKTFYAKINPKRCSHLQMRNVMMGFLSMLKNHGENRYMSVQRELQKHIQECESHFELINHYESRRKLFNRKDISFMVNLHNRLNTTKWK